MGNESVVDRAQRVFLSRFRDHVLPTAAELIEAGTVFKQDKKFNLLYHIIKEVGAVSSGSEAKRLMKAGAVSINGKKVTDSPESYESPIGKSYILKVGKRRFFLVYDDEEQLKIASN